MTSDAKIGLLLGLVFIFIIAFIINGLPRFRSATNNSELTTNMVSLENDKPGIGARQREAQKAFDWKRQANEQPPEEIKPSLEDEEDVRFRIQLPESISVVRDTSVEEVPEPVEPAPVESVGPVVAVPVADEKTEVKKPEPAKPTLPKVYVVCEDDNLALIAAKFYGPEEGSKRANIMRVFAANGKVLKSPDEIYVGQKLVIPPLKTSEPPESAFPRSIFEKVKSIGKKHLLPDRSKAKQSGEYVVRDADNLWRIAASQLGDGSRYKEISKLNAGILEDEDTLAVGMRLRMPSQ
ncbi:MAG: LysM peptidoglycan-binding domain-containing protein [Planctomycetota bacterium]|jgi:nucleoid-associated protein YgaU